MKPQERKGRQPDPDKLGGEILLLFQVDIPLLRNKLRKNKQTNKQTNKKFEGKTKKQAKQRVVILMQINKFYC